MGGSKRTYTQISETDDVADVADVTHLPTPVEGLNICLSGAIWHNGHAVCFSVRTIIGGKRTRRRKCCLKHALQLIGHRTLPRTLSTLGFADTTIANLDAGCAAKYRAVLDYLQTEYGKAVSDSTDDSQTLCSHGNALSGSCYGLSTVDFDVFTNFIRLLRVLIRTTCKGR